MALQPDPVAVEEAGAAGRVAAAPAAFGRDAEVGDEPRRGRDSALVAVAVVVVDDAEIVVAALGQSDVREQLEAATGERDSALEGDWRGRTGGGS